MTLRQVLTELGVYAPPRRGKPPTYTPEEARHVKRLQSKLAQAATRATDKARKEAGLEPLVRKRGRPRIYATPEEAKAVQRAQNAVCEKRLKARIEEALRALKPILDFARDAQRAPTDEAARSNSQIFFPL